jgi:hypothetical protein
MADLVAGKRQVCTRERALGHKSLQATLELNAQCSTARGSCSAHCKVGAVQHSALHCTPVHSATLHIQSGVNYTRGAPFSMPFLVELSRPGAVSCAQSVYQLRTHNIQNTVYMHGCLRIRSYANCAVAEWEKNPGDTLLRLSVSVCLSA